MVNRMLKLFGWPLSRERQLKQPKKHIRNVAKQLTNLTTVVCVSVCVHMLGIRVGNWLFCTVSQWWSVMHEQNWMQHNGSTGTALKLKQIVKPFWTLKPTFHHKTKITSYQVKLIPFSTQIHWILGFLEIETKSNHSILFQQKEKSCEYRKIRITVHACLCSLKLCYRHFQNNHMNEDS